MWRWLHRQQEETAEILSQGSSKPEKLLEAFPGDIHQENLLPGCVKTQTKVVDGAKVLSLVPLGLVTHVPQLGVVHIPCVEVIQGVQEPRPWTGKQKLPVVQAKPFQLPWPL